MLEPIAQFQEATSVIANQWREVTFSNPRHHESPSQHFGRVVSVDTVKEAQKLSQRADAPWAHIAYGVAGTALGIFAVASGAGVVGLGVAAAFGGGSSLLYGRSKKRADQIQADVEVAEKYFPKFQKDLDKILGTGVELATSANRAFQDGEISDKQRREAIRQIHKTIRDFASEELGIDDDVLKSGHAHTKTNKNSSKVIDEVSHALSGLEHLHDEPGAVHLKPMTPGISRGTAKDLSDGTMHSEFGETPPPVR